MPPPQQIIYLNTTLQQGGTERNLVQYCLSLDRQQFEPQVWYLYETTPSLRPRLESANVSTLWLGAAPDRKLSSLISIAKRLARSNADLIHVFLPTVAYHAVMAKSLFRSRIPIIFSSGGTTLSLPLQKSLMRFGIGRYCDPILCNSETIRQFWLDLGVGPERLVVLPNGHDLDIFEQPVDRMAVRKKLGIASDESMLLTVGRLAETKRHRDLLAAFAQRASQNRRPAQLVIAGDGPQRNALEQQAMELGIAERVHFLGNSDDVISLLKSTDLFVFASELEGLPNAVIEATLAGCPVVAADIAPTREVVRDGTSALLFQVGDIPALTTAMDRILDRPELGRQLATVARQESQQRFDLKKVNNQLQAIYRETICRKGTPLSATR